MNKHDEVCYKALSIIENARDDIRQELIAEIALLQGFKLTGDSRDSDTAKGFTRVWIELDAMTKHMKNFISGRISREDLEKNLSRDVVCFGPSRAVAERVLELLEEG